MPEHDDEFQRVDVVMDVEWLDDGSVRVHCLGVFTPGHPKPAGANVVQTWLNVERHHARPGVFNIDTRAALSGSSGAAALNKEGE